MLYIHTSASPSASARASARAASSSSSAAPPRPFTPPFTPPFIPPFTPRVRRGASLSTTARVTVAFAAAAAELAPKPFGADAILGAESILGSRPAAAAHWPHSSLSVLCRRRRWLVAPTHSVIRSQRNSEARAASSALLKQMRHG